MQHTTLSWLAELTGTRPSPTAHGVIWRSHRTCAASRPSELLVEHIGHLEPHQVHDATLAPLISKRIADGVCAVTIIERWRAHDPAPRGALVPRRARAPWLDALPPLITMLPGSARSPYPITWVEQDRLRSPEGRGINDGATTWQSQPSAVR
jgi:hypothetical protein